MGKDISILEGKKNNEDKYIEEVLNDYRICKLSREVSLLGRKEVLTGKAKFGILGDGKELPQVILAKQFKKGDFRSGYYRDQTLMFALDLCSVEDYFAQLYADSANDPFSGGRQMNAHFATPLIDENEDWTRHTDTFNVSSDISCTAGQMARGVGLALASKIYKDKSNTQLDLDNNFSKKGQEICFVTIGDASTSEGVFWESMNAAAVMQVPMLVSVWDDGYGISVPKKYQTVKESISKALAGMQIDDKGNGIHIFNAKAWDYPGLLEAYERAEKLTRSTHIPALVHVEEVTQPQGHSTSGSHERYKDKERLEWEKENDCIHVMREWMISNELSSREALDEMDKAIIKEVRDAKNKAWSAYIEPIEAERKTLTTILDKVLQEVDNVEIKNIITAFNKKRLVLFSDLVSTARKILAQAHRFTSAGLNELRVWTSDKITLGNNRYESHLYASSSHSALNIPVVEPRYDENAPLVNAYELINKFFDSVFDRDPRTFAFGEDVGKIGDVNQGMADLQKKYGEGRIFDAGIREWTLIGQAIGMSMRGLRPIVEIQYLDYILYGLEPLSDDVATLRYRSNNLQQAPMIVRTRGHRLEGIWHSGSPIGLLVNALRGMYFLVPRNLTQAAGMYNTLLQSNEPALVIEPLNGYRLKEKLPNNIGDYTVALGVPEVLRKGTDVTLVTYGSCVNIARGAVKVLEALNISVELIDVQSLLPFDLENHIGQSIQKTNKIIFLDEDVSSGGTAYMMNETLVKNKGYQYLDEAPVCISAKDHRPPYGSDGDYFTKPSQEDIVDVVCKMMNDYDPRQFPLINML